MNRVYFDVDFLMQPSRFAGATVFFNSIGETAGKASLKILGAPHSRRCFLKNVCFSVQNPVEMGIFFSKSMLKSARLIFCIVIRRNLTGTFYADSPSPKARDFHQFFSSCGSQRARPYRKPSKYSLSFTNITSEIKTMGC